MTAAGGTRPLCGSGVGEALGAGVYVTWKSYESAIAASSEHASDIEYAFNSASPGTSVVAWPLFSKVSVRMTFPSASTTVRSNVSQAPASPRNVQSSSHSTLETQVKDVPISMMRR